LVVAERGLIASLGGRSLVCNRLIVCYSIVVALAVGALERYRRLQVRVGGRWREGGFLGGDPDEP